jgi:hypothetical protein
VRHSLHEFESPVRQVIRDRAPRQHHLGRPIDIWQHIVRAEVEREAIGANVEGPQKLQTPRVVEIRVVALKDFLRVGE